MLLMISWWFINELRKSEVTITREQFLHVKIATYVTVGVVSLITSLTQFISKAILRQRKQKYQLNVNTRSN